jgi:flavin-dependent dehydrogenase
MGQNTAQQLTERLHRFLCEEQISAGAAQFYSHVLPSPQPATLRHRQIVGRNWALVGDAAAWVDPLTGEGLHYALRSGDLLAQAIANGHPEQYPDRVRAEFSPELEFAAGIARRFYCGRFLGGEVTRRMIQFTRRSATFRALMRDIFSGRQEYRSLKRRLWRQLGRTLGEIGVSLVKKPPGASNPPLTYGHRYGLPAGRQRQMFARKTF